MQRGPDAATYDAIIRAAAENGIKPAEALAIAERESNFNPRARSSKTIEGIFQMRGDLRREYDVPDGADAATQAAGWGKFFADNKATMAKTLGRDPTDAEGYLGHHFGSTRAAKMLQMDPQTPVSTVFSPYERELNPHFDTAGTVGRLNESVMGDIHRRAQNYGGDVNLADRGTPLEGGGNNPSPSLDLSQHGAVLSQGPDLPSNGTENLNTSAPAASSAPDFANLGTPV